MQCHILQFILITAERRTALAFKVQRSHGCVLDVLCFPTAALMQDCGPRNCTDGICKKGIMPQCVDFQQGGCVHDLLSLKSCGLLLGALGPYCCNSFVQVISGSPKEMTHMRGVLTKDT